MAVRTHSDKRRALMDKLLTKIKLMRSAQKASAASKSTGLLHESKAQERDCDAILLDISVLELYSGDVAVIPPTMFGS